MRHHLTKLVPAFLVGGCSLIYNPSNISKPPIDATDGQTVDMEMTADAAIDAPPLADANPAALSLEKLAPMTLLEGQGATDSGSRPALLVIRGHHITPDATVTITPATDLTQGTPVVSMNRDFILVPITVAINETMDSGLVPLTVTVSQPGATDQMLTGQLSLQYLPELDTAGATMAVTALAPLYSRVMLSSDIRFTGTDVAKVRAVSSIQMANIDVSGSNAANDAAGAAGAGGCAGGAVGANGGCTPGLGGGGGAAAPNGGGGGGFGTVGMAGGGGGAGGAVHGNPEIVNYVAGSTDTNRSGGGGGGQGTGFGQGGAGGGGGGTLELVAGGNITTGAITANGGNGAGGSAGVTNLTDGSGGGGGGSGGVIVIRTVAGTLTTGAVSAIGGSPGAGRLGGASGGAGGEGRIRIDAPGTIPSTNPTAYRGPSFAAATPVVSTIEKPMVTLTGTTSGVVNGYVVDMDNQLRLGEPTGVVFAGGAAVVEPTLIPGLNRLCFSLEPAARPTVVGPPHPLADSCIDIVYLP